MLSASPEIAFLAHLPPSLRRLAESRMRRLRASKGQTVLGRGSQCRDVYFVLEGRLQVVIYSSTGKDVLLRILEPGEMFGELAAIDGHPRSASIVAVSDARLLLMKQQDFMAFLESSPELGLWLGRYFAGQVRDLTERIFELTLLNVQARLHCELLRLIRSAERGSGAARINPAPTHAELAARIGTSREAVSREMRELAKAGVIRGGRRRIEVVNIGALERTVQQAGADDLLGLLPADRQMQVSSQ